MSDSDDPRRPPAGPGRPEDRDGQSAGRERPGQLERYEGPKTLTQVLGQALEKLTGIVAPQLLRALGKNLKHVTSTRKRLASFALSMTLGVAIAAAVMAVAATYGYMLGLPFSAAVLVFVGCLAAFSVSNVGALSDRWTTPELDEIDRLCALRDAKFDAIQAYAEERRRVGVEVSTIADEVASQQQKVLDEHLAALKKLSRNKKKPPPALPPAGRPPDNSS